jgi:hypothetical protein
MNRDESQEHPMNRQLDATPSIVIHGTAATVFGAVGLPVPADAPMGLAEAMAVARLDQPRSRWPELRRPSRFGLRWSAAGGR